jgi:hypothetical protein
VPNTPFAFGLFISSYSPAFLILAVRSFHHSTILFVAALATAVVSAAAFFLFIRLARQGGPFRAEVGDVEPRDGDLAAYVATYLLPFVVVFGATVQDVIALALFLVFIGVLWIDSRMLYLNPLLALVGYHVFVVRLHPVGADAEHALPRSFLLSRTRDLRPGDEVRPDRLSPGVFIDLNPARDAT